MLSLSLLAISALSVSAKTTITRAPTATPTVAPKVNAASSPLPLTDYTYAYSNVPYQVNPYNVGRGPQSGYNQCNSTTEGPNSNCQTAVLNTIDDWCTWGAPTAGSSIGDVEAAVVAYCTKSGHGARIIPPGAITGIQVLKTSAYTQWTGFINQTALGLLEDDSGGELDPHGADQLGNPLGGLVYSSGLPSSTSNTSLTQVISWNNFIGSGVFCFKICDPTVTSPNYCQNVYDLIGCSYNMPAAYVDNEFSVCDSELQDVVGTYTSNGQTYTWSQPSSLPATSTLPWTPRVPSSSNCVTYQSAELFPTSALGYQASAAATASSTMTSAASSASGTSKAGASSRSGSGSAAGASNTAAAASAGASKATSGASSMVVSSGLLLLVAGVTSMML